MGIHSTLLAAGAVTGHFLLIQRAGETGLDRQRAAGFSAALLLGAVVGGHGLFLLQHPEAWDWNPLAGAATLGCLLGAALGGVLYLRRYQLGSAYFAAGAWAFPFAWMVGRSGCALAGEPLTQWEVLYAAVLAVFFWSQRRAPLPFAAILLVSYGMLRLLFCAVRVHAPAADLAGASVAIFIGMYWNQRRFAC